MPLAKIVKKIPLRDGTVHETRQVCVLVREGEKWGLLDPESNNELVKGATTNFLKKEIEAGRLELEDGWEPQKN